MSRLRRKFVYREPLERYQYTVASCRKKRIDDESVSHTLSKRQSYQLENLDGCRGVGKREPIIPFSRFEVQRSHNKGQ
jgi:hypothetical protein